MASSGEPFLERHYTVQEIAAFWRLDPSTVRRIFRDEPGVLRIGKSGRRDGKRDYVVLRVPESVLRRVWGKRARQPFMVERG